MDRRASRAEASDFREQLVLDMIVDDKVVVETKATQRLHESAAAQLFGYLAATKYEVGLVLHFGRDAKAHRVLFENRFKKHK